MKKKLSAILITIILMAFSTSSFAEQSIKVKLDGNQLNFDVPPQIIGGRTMVPLRKIFESLGASIDWNQSTQTVIAQKEGTNISLKINSNKAIVNGQTITLETKPQVINGRTMVPARFISESMGCYVRWDQSTKTVLISSYSIEENMNKKQAIDILMNFKKNEGTEVNRPLESDVRLERIKDNDYYKIDLTFTYRVDSQRTRTTSEGTYYIELSTGNVYGYMRDDYEYYMID